MKLFGLIVILSLIYQNQARQMVPSYIDPLTDSMINFINEINTTWKVRLALIKHLLVLIIGSNF
jgi:peptidase family C1 propeptide